MNPFFTNPQLYFSFILKFICEESWALMCLRIDNEPLIEKFIFDEDIYENCPQLETIEAPLKVPVPFDNEANSFAIYLLDELTKRLPPINLLNLYREDERDLKTVVLVRSLESRCKKYNSLRINEPMPACVRAVLDIAATRDLISYFYAFLRGLDKPLFVANKKLINIVSLDDFYMTQSLCNRSNRKITREIDVCMMSIEDKCRVYLSKIMTTFHHWIMKHVEFRIKNTQLSEANDFITFFDEAVNKICEKFSSKIIELKDSDISRLLQKNQAAMKSIHPHESVKIGRKSYRFLNPFCEVKRKFESKRTPRDSLGCPMVNRLKFQSLKSLSEIDEKSLMLEQSILNECEEFSEPDFNTGRDLSLSLLSDMRSSTNNLICGRVSLRGLQLKRTILYHLLSSVNFEYWQTFSQANLKRSCEVQEK